MDALSDVLRTIRLTGGVFLDAAFTAPWCVVSRVVPEDCPAIELPPSVVAFHYVVDGRMLVQPEGAAPVEVRAGQMALIPRNDPHLLASEAGLPPAHADPPVQTVDGGLMRLEYGGGGAATRLVCGYVGADVRRHPLLEALPTVFALDLNGKPCAEFVAASFRYAAQEVASGRAASETVLAKLSELLFVEAVRQYADALPSRQQGWLAGLRDPAIGRALALLHARVAHPCDLPPSAVPVDGQESGLQGELIGWGLSFVVRAASAASRRCCSANRAGGMRPRLLCGRTSL